MATPRRKEKPLCEICGDQPVASLRTMACSACLSWWRRTHFMGRGDYVSYVQRFEHRVNRTFARIREREKGGKVLKKKAS